MEYKTQNENERPCDLYDIKNAPPYGTIGFRVCTGANVLNLILFVLVRLSVSMAVYTVITVYSNNSYFKWCH